MSVEAIIDRVDGTSGYVRFLLAESYFIRSALYARGVSFDPDYRVNSYSTSIGNDLHLDLLYVEQWLASLSKKDREFIEEWVEMQDIRPVYGAAETRHLMRLLKRLHR